MLTQKPIKLSDYVAYPFHIPDIKIDFNIDINQVNVKTIMIIEPNYHSNSDLELKGRDINLISISINGKKLDSNDYELSSFTKEGLIYTPSQLQVKPQVQQDSELIIDKAE